MEFKKLYAITKQLVLKEEPTVEDNKMYGGIKIYGDVIPGNGLGSTIGFPTANLNIDEGVYNLFSNGRAYQEKFGNLLDFHLIADVKIEEKIYKGILTVEYVYNWAYLRESLAKGYKPQDQGHIAIRELENGKYKVADGNHRHKVLMELYGEDEIIEVRTKDGDNKIISVRLGDINPESQRHFEENKISVHIFDFSDDIYGKHIEVHPKQRVTEGIMGNVFKIVKQLK